MLPRNNDDHKIYICHYPPGNPDNPQWISIDEHAWESHQKHGDHKDQSQCVSQSQSTTSVVLVTSVPETTTLESTSPTTEPVASVETTETTTTVVGASVTTAVGPTGTLPETGYGTEALLVIAPILILIGTLVKRFQHHG